MASLLGAVLGGGAEGGAKAELAAQAQERQTQEQMALNQEQEALKDQYAQAVMQRQMAVRQNMSTAINAEQQKQLEARGLIAPNAASDASSINAQYPGSNVQPADVAALEQPGNEAARAAYNLPTGTVATDDQLTTAYNIAARKLGFQNPDDVLKYATADDLKLIQANATMEAAKLQAYGRAQQGVAAAQVRADNPPNLDYHNDVALSRQVQQTRLMIADLNKTITDPLQSAEAKSNARSQLATQQQRLLQLQDTQMKRNGGLIGPDIQPTNDFSGFSIVQ